MPGGLSVLNPEAWHRSTCEGGTVQAGVSGGFAPLSSANSWMDQQQRNRGKPMQNIWFPLSLLWKDPPWVSLSSSSCSAHPDLIPVLLQHHSGVLQGRCPWARPLGTEMSWVLRGLDAHGLHCTSHQIPPGWWGYPHGGAERGWRTPQSSQEG